MEFVSYRNWAQLPESADKLFEKAEKNSMFFSRPWFENLHATALDDDQSMVLACVQQDDNVMAILPLMKRPGGHWHSLSHLYSSLFTLLLDEHNKAEHDQKEVLQCLVKGLQELPLQSLRLAPVAEHDSAINSLRDVMKSAGLYADHYFRFYNWFHRVNGDSFEAYMSVRPAKVRNTIARKQRKLEREHGYSIRLFKGDDVQQALTDYNAVYQSSWKANEQFAEILEGTANRFAEKGWTRLAVLYIQDKPVAAQLWFVVGAKANIFRLAYDEGWRQYSPGSILTQYLMEYVIDIDKVEEIDFLTGNEVYKQDWMSERRQRMGLYCAKQPDKPESRLDFIFKFIKQSLRNRFVLNR